MKVLWRTKEVPTKEETVVNALIQRASLYVEDYGLWTATLDLKYDSSFGGCQGFGGYNFGPSGGDPRATMMLFVMRCCETVGVSSWEALKDKHVRVHISAGSGCSNQIYGIGNIMDSDRWFYPKQEFELFVASEAEK